MTGLSGLPVPSGFSTGICPDPDGVGVFGAESPDEQADAMASNARASGISNYFRGVSRVFTGILMPEDHMPVLSPNSGATGYGS